MIPDFIFCIAFLFFETIFAPAIIMFSHEIIPKKGIYTGCSPLLLYISSSVMDRGMNLRSP